MGQLIAVAGTPGTGKKSVAPLVARILGLEAISINDLAISHGLAEALEDGSFEVDTKGLARILLRTVRRRCVVYGHLVADVLLARQVDRVVGLRCDPSVLKRRLLARGYPWDKVVANVEAELIGLVSYQCGARLGRHAVVEVDTSRRTPEESASQAARGLGSRAVAPPIDWMGAYASAAKFRSLFSTERTESARI